MSMVDNPPHIRQLEAGVADLEGADFLGMTGIAGVKARHYRHRHATTSERPGIGVRWVGCDPAAPDGPYLTAWEQEIVSHWQLVIDVKVETEGAGTDKTGWGDASLVGVAAYAVLNNPASALRQLCDRLTVPPPAPDEDSKPDDGRLVYPFDVIYRVRTDDPNELLAPGENAT